MAENNTGGVAVIGMACIFPGAPNVRTYWNNIATARDVISDVPESRWESLFYDPDSTDVDRFYCRRGGFIDDFASFDSLRFGVMPVAAQGSEPDQLLALQVASDALQDAGYAKRPFARERTGVVLGRGNYIGAGMTRLEQHVRTSQQLVHSLKQLLPSLPEETLDEVKKAFQEKLGTYGPDTAIGLVPNLTASRISNRLDLQGPAYTVDGACASSLLAIDHAVRDLRTRRCDLVLAGGIHLSHDVAFWSVFCQLGALSRTEQIRPFSQNADGLLIGEGLGVVVLKRLEDAQQDGDRIYAVVRGVGVSSDGRETSLMMPRIDGQVNALQQAWDDAGLDPDTVGLIEAHGTATPVGDTAELATLERFFGPVKNGTRAGLGSVKSMIGHTMPAAGIAGFIKAALSVYHGTLPPTLHCDDPNPAIEKTRFRLIRQAEVWAETKRRAGVNAFGFGGINAHVVLESHGDAVAPGTGDIPDVAVYGAADPAALLAVLDGEAPNQPEGLCRLVVEDPHEERLARARVLVEKGRRNTGRHGIWFEPEAPLMCGGKVAFVYPGVEAVFAPNIDDLWEAMDLEPLPEVEKENLETHGFALIQLERVLTAVLRDGGIEPDRLAGHSIGEWTGMITSGMIPESAVADFVDSLVPGSLSVPGVSFLAAGCGLEKAQNALSGLPDVAVSHDNCPHQVILCGHETSILEARSRLEADRVLCQTLPFRSGFHSPLFGDFVAPHREHFASLPMQAPVIPLWSATHAQPFSDDPERIRATALEHLTEKVRFREVIEGLYDDGVRFFVQVGPGSLTGFINDTLRGRPHMAMAAVDERRPALHQLQRLRCALAAAGMELEPTAVLAREDQPTRTNSITLSLGVPLVSIDCTLPATHGMPPQDELSGDNPVIQEFNHMLRDVLDAGTAVVRAYRENSTVTESPTEGSVDEQLITKRVLSVDECPDLTDHTFFRQPVGWPHMVDRFPVVPLTMLIKMMRDAGQALAPDKCIVSVQHLRAYNWLRIEPEVTVTIRAGWTPDRQIRVAIEGYAECLLEVEEEWPEAPVAPPWAGATGGADAITSQSLYEDRWMFHGPAYQGVATIDSVTDDGIWGTLTNRPAEGALLDNAGQLLGYWVMIRTDVNRLAMPVTVDRIRWYGPALGTNETVECQVFIRKLGDRQVRADMILLSQGRVWAEVTGWTDQRFDTNERSWPVIRFPENNILSEPIHDGMVILEDIFHTSASQDYYHRRYLNAAEREQYEGLSDARKAPWLAGRIAAKDAVRQWLWDRGNGPIFPVEIGIDNEDTGQPVVLGKISTGLHISIAHKGSVAVARVGEEAVGVDIEHIEKRRDRFVDNALTADEQTHLPDGNRDEWVTRFWAAKEAAGKRNGTGLNGSPRNVLVSEVRDSRVCAGDVWVDTERRGDAIVAWTVSE